MNLDDIYNTSIAEIPSPGRYSVLMRLSGFYQVILEKTINKKGQNHLPIFFLRKFNIPFMSFEIHFDVKDNEVIFEYDNGKLIDKLRKRKDKNEFLGKIFYRGRFLDYFILRRK